MRKPIQIDFFLPVVCICMIFFLLLASHQACGQQELTIAEQNPRFGISDYTFYKVRLVRRISVDFYHTPMEKALRDIAHKSGLVLSYRKDYMTSKLVSFSGKKISASGALNKVLENTGLDWLVSRDGYLIIRKKELKVQSIRFEVSGKVTDASTGNSLPGVNVFVKGTTNGTATDTKGHYDISVSSPNDTLVFSYIGYQTREIPIDGIETINVKLSQETFRSKELVVVGYSSQRKKDLTGAVSIANVDELKSIPVSSVSSMLQGRLAGVYVIDNNTPGGGAAVRIRGFSTIQNDDPLYIIDGVPTSGGMNMIDPSNIQSLQVLKDASSASIYGSRAANGVIVITTKRGDTKKLQVDVNTYSGIQQVSKLPRMLNAQQYGNMLWQAMKNDGETPSNDVYGNGATPQIPTWLDANHTVHSANVNWPAEIFHTAVIQKYDIGFSKGDKSSQHYFSVGYYNQDGILKYTNFKRIDSRLNSDYNILNHLMIGENLSASYSWTTQVENNSALGGVVFDSYKFPSIAPVYDTNGNFAGNPLNDISNPLGTLYRNKSNTQKQLQVFGNAYADLKITNQVHIKSNIGIDYSNFNLRDFSPSFAELLTQQLQSSLNTQNNYSYNWVWSNTLDAEHSIGRHRFRLLVGTEANKYYIESFSASRLGFPSTDPNFQYLSAGSSSEQKNNGTGSEWALFSYFGKLNYNYADKYLASFTIRRDGTSKLANHKYGIFPAFSLGWRISNESFFNVPFVNNLKLRFSWGENGNQDIPSYSTLTSYQSDLNYSNYPIEGQQNSVNQGFTQTRNGNPNLRWETTDQTDIGIDAALFHQRISLTVDYFLKKTRDLLLQRPLSPTLGGTNQTIWDNAGSMKNQGFEFLVNYNSNVNREFRYQIGLNGTILHNELTSLPADVSYIGLPGSVLHSTNFDQEVSRTYVGYPIASFYGYVAEGLFQNEQQIKNHALQPGAQPGDIMFKDINHDGVIDSKDRTFIGSPLPDFTMGLNFSANWKNWDFSLFTNGSFGNKIYDLTRYYSDFFNLSSYNKSVRVLNAWTPQNTNTSVPRLSLNDNNDNIRPSSYYVFNGSYVRIKNVQIGYTIPQFNRLVGGQGKLRIYLQVSNLVTFTGYKGLDPAVGLQNYSSSNRNLDIGVDRGIYPPSRTFTLGLNLTL